MLTRFKHSDGFTLIELMAVMVILSVWSAVIVKKVVAITDTSERNALVQGVVELNTRESLTWYSIKMSSSGYQNDEKLWNEMDTDLGDGYVWTTEPTKHSGNFRTPDIVILTR